MLMTTLEDTASPLSSLFLIIAAYLFKDISDFILSYSVQVFPSPQFISHTPRMTTQSSSQSGVGFWQQ